jgi:hypothetical protein
VEGEAWPFEENAMRKKENEPEERPKRNFGGRVMTEEEFLGLPFPERAAFYLLSTRYAAEVCAFWKSCRLPVCRRAKACRGKVRPSMDMPQWQLAFPPCAHGSEEKKEILIAAAGRIYDEYQARHPK